MMLDIWAFGSSDVWMVGGNALAHYDGAGWEVRDLSEEHSGLSGLAGIWGTAPDDLWVVGEQSTVAHWDGSTWTRHIAAGRARARLPNPYAAWIPSDSLVRVSRLGPAMSARPCLDLRKAFGFPISG